MLVVAGARVRISVCENLDLPINEHVGHVRQIPVVSRKISNRDWNMRGMGV